MDTVGGYRLVRKLGSGERAEVFLGHAGSDAAAAGVRTAAVKVFRPGIAQEGIDSEVEVLTRTSSPHLLALLDLSTVGDGRPCLVLPRLAAGSLARLLSDRSSIAPGEAVTILAPLCGAVSDLHRAGACHGAITPSSILFDEAGAPVLACFGNSFVFGGGHDGRDPVTIARLAAEPGVAGDLRQLTSLVGAVLAMTRLEEAPGSGAARLLTWLREVDPGEKAEGFAQELGERLFQLSRPTQVDFGRSIGTSSDAVRPRADSIRAAVSGAPPSRSTANQVTATAFRGSGSSSIAEWALSSLLRTMARIPGHEEAAAMTLRLRVMLSSVRKPFWVAGAVGVAAVVLAIMLLPSTAATGAAPTQATAGPEPVPTPSRIDLKARESTSASGGEAASDPVVSDDPVAAAGILLDRRDECIRTLSVLCLDAVDQQSSSAMEDDSYLIRSLQEGGAEAGKATTIGRNASLSERLGDSALLVIRDDDGIADDADGGMPILLVKGESGWRIRDFLAR